MLTVGSLFSGIGGLELGLERAGMKTIWQVERDPYARAVLAKNFPGVPCYEDVTALDPARLVRPDVLCGGFPCQPHSLAGKRRASADERDLWDAFVDIIRGTSPMWVLAENVPGLLSSEGGEFFGRILRDLASLGFDAEWTVRGARDVGAPHRRDRVFLLAYPLGLELRQQPGRGGRPDGQGPALAGEHGPQGVMADPSRFRRAQGRRRAPGAFEAGHLAFGGARERRPWPPEPGVGRVAHGVPARPHRMRLLGNAVVPTVAEDFGWLIAAAHARLTASR